MREVFLYGCEDCGLVIGVEFDKGRKFLVPSCIGCNNNGRYYEKIVFVGNRFIVEEKG